MMRLFTLSFISIMVLSIAINPAHPHGDPPGTGINLEVTLNSITYTKPGDGNDGDLRTRVWLYHLGHGTGLFNSGRNNNRPAGTYIYNRLFYSHFECKPLSSIEVQVRAKDYDDWLRGGDDTGTGHMLDQEPTTGHYRISFGGKVEGHADLYILAYDAESQGECSPQEPTYDFTDLFIQLVFKLLDGQFAGRESSILSIKPGEQFSMSVKLTEFTSESADTCHFTITQPRLVEGAKDSQDKIAGGKLIRPIKAGKAGWFKQNKTEELKIEAFGTGRAEFQGSIPKDTEPGLYAISTELRCIKSKGKPFTLRTGIIQVK